MLFFLLSFHYVFISFGAFFSKCCAICNFAFLRSTIFYVYIVFFIIFCCSSISFDFTFFCIFFFYRCWHTTSSSLLLPLLLPLSIRLTRTLLLSLSGSFVATLSVFRFRYVLCISFVYWFLWLFQLFPVFVSLSLFVLFLPLLLFIFTSWLSKLSK